MWTDERVELLQKLWGQGYSASQIANQLQGVTRNAVIGKIHRLSKRASAPKATRIRTGGFGMTVARRRPAPEARRIPGAPPEWVLTPHYRAMDEEAPGLATCTTLAAHMCRWPIGDPNENGFTFCGQPSEGERPYCEGHARMAYKRGSGGQADVNRLLARYL